ISDADGLGTITNDDGLPAIVYVDDNWVGTTPGADPDGAGPATSFGFDAFATIGDGVNGVAVGGTVMVADGTYSEHVAVNKQVALRGQQNGTDARTRSAAESIVDGAGYSPFNVTVNNVIIDGFTIQG